MQVTKLMENFSCAQQTSVQQIGAGQHGGVCETQGGVPAFGVGLDEGCHRALHAGENLPLDEHMNEEEFMFLENLSCFVLCLN